MVNYNETDFQNALSVLNKCNEYIKEQVGDITKNADFTDIQLLHLGSTGYPTSRGGCDYYLCVTSNYYMLQAKGKCANGYVKSDDIALKPERMKYAYNATPQATIDLAVKIVAKWEAIKTGLQNSIIHYHNRAKENSNILSNFQI